MVKTALHKHIFAKSGCMEALHQGPDPPINSSSCLPPCSKLILFVWTLQNSGHTYTYVYTAMSQYNATESGRTPAYIDTAKSINNTQPYQSTFPILSLLRSSGAPVIGAKTGEESEEWPSGLEKPLAQVDKAVPPSVLKVQTRFCHH